MRTASPPGIARQPPFSPSRSQYIPPTSEDPGRLAARTHSRTICHLSSHLRSSSRKQEAGTGSELSATSAHLLGRRRSSGLTRSPPSNPHRLSLSAVHMARNSLAEHQAVSVLLREVRPGELSRAGLTSPVATSRRKRGPTACPFPVPSLPSSIHSECFVVCSRLLWTGCAKVLF